LADPEQSQARSLRAHQLAGNLDVLCELVRLRILALRLQQEVAKFGESFVDFPPIQQAASFNLEAVKAQITKAIQARQGQ
jgi:hypothetical protein